MNNDCWVYVEKELIRLNKRAIERVGNNGVLQVFPSTKHNATTCMVLKRPKSQTSIRKVWIPNTLALILREWKKKQDELKESPELLNELRSLLLNDDETQGNG